MDDPGAKYAKISKISCVESLVKALMPPLAPGTIAMFEVIAASNAFRFETVGRAVPSGHRVMQHSRPAGTTVALKTYAWAGAGTPQLPLTLMLRFPRTGVGRVSRTRHGERLNSDSPPGTGGAKYPLMSMIRPELSLTNTEMSPLALAGTMAALAVMVPVGAFSVETLGRAGPAGHVVRKFKNPWGSDVKFNE